MGEIDESERVQREALSLDLYWVRGSKVFRSSSTTFFQLKMKGRNIGLEREKEREESLVEFSRVVQQLL